MSVNRRQFVASTLAAGAAAQFLGTSRANAADDTATRSIRVAQIGVRGQGRGHLGNLHQNLVAICDVDEEVLHDRAAMVKEKWGKDVELFTDYREMVQRDDIDAVSIATPNHTHAIITIAAAAAGKDVYVEKPAAHNIWEGRQMAAAAQRYNRIIQCGTQSRSSPSLHAAVDFVRSGQLGKIEYAIGTCYKPRKSIGKLEKPLQIPDSIHYDLWCGPAEKTELYRPELHYDWHWDFNTGNGDMGNQGIHQMDIARWFLGEPKLAPRAISIGGRLGYDDAGNTPNTQITYLDYPKAPLIFETRGLPRSKEAQKNWGDGMDRHRNSRVGVIVQCEGGHVLVPSYVEAVVYDSSGREMKRFKGGRQPPPELAPRDCRTRCVAVERTHPRRAHLQRALPPRRNLAPTGRESCRGRYRRRDCQQRLVVVFVRANGQPPAGQRRRRRRQCAHARSMVGTRPRQGKLQRQQPGKRPADARLPRAIHDSADCVKVEGGVVGCTSNARHAMLWLQLGVGCDKRSAGTPVVRTIGVPALRLSHPT